MEKSPSGLVFRPASPDDLPRIVELLRDDVLGCGREASGESLPESYRDAFREIERTGNSRVFVAVLLDRVIGTFQMIYVRTLAHQGARIAEIGSVRVASEFRGHGIGSEMIRWAAEEARRGGCAQLRLSTDRTRVGAHRFYARLGFQTTHLGMKMRLAQV